MLTGERGRGRCPTSFAPGTGAELDNQSHWKQRFPSPDRGWPRGRAVAVHSEGPSAGLKALPMVSKFQVTGGREGPRFHFARSTFHFCTGPTHSVADPAGGTCLSRRREMIFRCHTGKAFVKVSSYVPLSIWVGTSVELRQQPPGFEAIVT